MKYLLSLIFICSMLITSCSDTPITDIEDEGELPELPLPDEPDKPVTSLPPLRVAGRYLKNEAGEVVNLHGFAQTYSPFSIKTGGTIMMWQVVSVITSC